LKRRHAPFARDAFFLGEEGAGIGCCGHTLQGRKGGWRSLKKRKGQGIGWGKP
jgi:hypothetical protein